MLGVDKDIERARGILNANISGLTMYGRAFRNYKVDKNIPSLYLSNNEYREILFEDNENLGFFYEMPNINVPVSGYGEAEIYVCFAVNLSELYPSVTERADQYLIRDVINSLDSTPFQPNRLVTGHEAFDLWDLEKLNNVHPYYLLRVECNLKYSFNC